MGSGIRQRGNSFLVDVTVAGVRRTCTAATVEQAKQAQADLRAELLRTVGANVEHGNTWTLQQAFNKTREVAWSDPGRSAGLLARNAEFAVEFFGPATPVSAIDADKLDEYTTHLVNQGNSNATVNRKLAAVSRMLSLAVARGKLSRKPVIQRKREGIGRVRFLSDAEEAAALKLLAHWGKGAHVDVFIVLIDTGLRGGELWRLEGRDCDMTQGLLSIWMTKNGHPRSVPMTDRVRAIVDKRRAMYRRGPLFPEGDNHWFDRVWSRMREALQLSQDSQFIPYALRHTCASRLIQRGVPLKVVQEWLGHKTITVTLRYAHLCPTNLLDAVKVLNTKEVEPQTHGTQRPQPPYTTAVPTPRYS